MDELDERIIDVLKKDSRTPFVKIAKDFNMTEGAIRARVKKLVNDKVIERFTIDVKNATRAVVMVATSQSVPTSQVTADIRNLGVGRIYEVSGNFDIVCFLEAQNIEDLNAMIEKIRMINGVSDTSTSMVLR